MREKLEKEVNLKKKVLQETEDLAEMIRNAELELEKARKPAETVNSVTNKPKNEAKQEA